MSESPNSAARDTIFLDICSDVADKGPQWTTTTGWRGDGSASAIRMNCAFQDTVELHGVDFCDIEFDALCTYTYEDVYTHWGWLNYVASQDEAKRLGGLKFWDYECSHKEIFCASGANKRRRSDDMVCTYTPMTDTCREQGWTVPISSMFSEKEAFRKLLDALGEDGEPPFPDLYTFPDPYNAQSPTSYSPLGLRHMDVFSDQMFGTWMKPRLAFLHGQLPAAVLANLPPAFEVREVQCPPHLYANLLNGQMKRESDASESIPQANSRHSMCHRIDNVCSGAMVDNFIGAESEEGKSECRVRYVRLPPGVAGRFFTTTKASAFWPHDGKRPTWTECPHDSTDEFAAYGKWKIPMERKAQERWYKPPENCPFQSPLDLTPADITPCTGQNLLTAEYGTCS
eukprot:346867-Rhodomonas_salina.1